MERIKELLEVLSVEELKRWAGTTIFNRGKSYLRQVDELCITEDGALAARVSGSDDYVTSVGLDPDGEVEFVCTCPYEYGGPCKHVVAVVLAAADRINRKQEIPPIDEDGDLFFELFGDDGDDGENDDYDCDYDDDDGEGSDEDFDEPLPPPKATAAKVKKNPQLVKILEKMSREALIALVVEASGRFPEIARDLLEKEQLATGKVDKLVASLRKEIQSVASEPAWYDWRRGEGNDPDYTHILEQLGALLKAGHPDEVVELGEELWTLGNEQVEQSRHDFDVTTSIAECMEVVLRALPHTRLAPHDQLLWVIDRTLEDDYGLLDSPDRVLGAKRYTKDQWGEVAGVLERRLAATSAPKGGRPSATYRRSKILDALLNACERSGNNRRVIPLLENEAHLSQCYGKLVDALLAAGERDKARQWCIEGFSRTRKDARDIATGLQQRLREMAREEKNFAMVAAYCAEDFFDCPSRSAYKELRADAEKANSWPAVRLGALYFLRTGRRPQTTGPSAAKAPWPLPKPEVGQSAGSRGGAPNLDMLIDVAILEHRFDDVVALYDELKKTVRYNTDTDQTVAKALAKSHPQVALDAWRRIVDGLIARVKPQAYEEAAVHLGGMRELFQENDRMHDWEALLVELRKEHKPKRRLMEVLDSLGKKGRR